MNDLTPNTEPILLCKAGTVRTDFQLGNLFLHDFTQTTGVQHIRAPEHSVFLLGSDVTVTDVWEGSRQQQHTYGHGDLIFLPAGSDVRADYVSNTYSETMVRLPQSAFSMLDDLLPPSAIDIRYRAISRDMTFGLTQAVRNLARLGGPAHIMPLLIESSTIALVAGIVAAMSNTAQRTIENLLDGLTDQRLARALDYIETHLADPITLQEIAGAAALSVYHFARSFKSRMGVSPVRYVWERRIQRARVLLRNPALRLIDVAAMSGFSSQSHMTKSFKQAVGVTPGAYRRSMG